jgi:hypothetical protein
MAAADLGITGVGLSYIWTLTYNPGEIVDADRVQRHVQGVRQQMDDSNHPLKILHVQILEITPAEPVIYPPGVREELT